MSKNICIVHGGDVSDPSGGTNRVIAFAKALHEAGFNVELIIPTPKRSLPGDLDGIRIHTVPIKANSFKDQILRALFISFKAKRVSKHSDTILQIEHSSLAGFATLLGCFDFVLDMHDLAFESPLYIKIKNLMYLLEKRAIKKALKVIVVSNPMKDFIIREWGIKDDMIKVIPNGYFDEKFKHLNFEDTTEVDGMISFIGTLHPKLDLEKIIKLAEALRYSKIYIVGDGPIREELEKRMYERKINNIYIVGKLPYEKALSFISRSQVVIAPYLKNRSIMVSCPVKIFDYAALGKAIVADNVAEICRTFKENDAALISDPSNPDEFVNNVRKLLENENLRKKLGHKAKNLVKKFTWEEQGKKLVKLYESIF